MFSTPTPSSPASNRIRLSKSALPVDRASSGSSVDVRPKNPASKFPSPSSNQIRFHQSVSPSTSTVEVSPRNPPLRYPSPVTGSTKTNRFRFSPSNITTDPVLATASSSSFDTLNSPATKLAPPTTGSVVSNQFLELASNQFHFSQLAHGSIGRIEVSLSNPATKFSPSTAGSVGSNQIRFSQSDASIVVIEANPKNSTSNFTPSPTGSNESNQIHFSRSSLLIEHGSFGAPISIVENNSLFDRCCN